MTENLDDIWKAASRSAAIEFLRRAIHADSTLASLKAALEFEGAAAHLETIKVRDVITPMAKAKPTVPAKEVPSAAATPRKRGKGKRRGKIDAMKRLVLHMLDESEGEVASGQVGQCLRDGGYETTPIHTYTLLKAMQTSGWVVGQGDHRKAWQITIDGRKKLQSNQKD